MGKLIYLGELSPSCNFGNISKLPYSLSTYQPLIAGFAQLLNSTTFAKKATISTTSKWEELFVSFKEKITSASIAQESRHGKAFDHSDACFNLEKMSLGDITSLPKHGPDFVLCHTVETHECDPMMVCPTCDGDGKCPDCHGKRYVKCDVCDGSKICPSCNGSGRYPCHSCNGTGQCKNCDGDGEEECDNCDGDGWVWVECHSCNGTGRYTLRNGYDVECKHCHGTGNHHKETCDDCGGDGTVTCHVCDGSGECQKCGGAGDVECRACHGNGKCGKCHGNGKLKCTTCKASGTCPRCDGLGEVQCTRCHGTGFYQTFNVIHLSEEHKELILRDKKSEVAEVDKGTKSTSYNGVPYSIEFTKVHVDDIPLLDASTSKSKTPLFTTKIWEYRNKFIDNNSRSKLEPNQCLETNVKVETMPVMKVVLSYAKKTFTFYIVGDNEAVYCDKKPNLLNSLVARFF